MQPQLSPPSPVGAEFVRITTEDADLLLPALAQRGASFRITGRRWIDVRGLTAADVAQLAAVHNARVTDLEAVRPVPGPGAAGRMPQG